MAQPHRPIKNIVVLGATGYVGRPVVDALSAHPARFAITAVTRHAAQAATLFPPGVRVAESDLSPASLHALFHHQDAVVNCLATALVATQPTVIDAALACNVARFVPTEYGLDPTVPGAAAQFPVIKAKIAVREYLRSSGIAWTTLVTGSFFDAQFQTPPPGVFGWNPAEHAVTLFDGGEVPFETTTYARIGAAVAAVLAPEHAAETANQIVYVNSFTTTQDAVVAVVQRVTGREWTVAHDTTAGLRARALAALEREPADGAPVLDLITASVYGQGGLNAYSKNAGDRGLWNGRLGLEQEDMVEAVRKALAAV